jgi:hypothetical protein
MRTCLDGWKVICVIYQLGVDSIALLGRAAGSLTLNSKNASS